jgi:mannosyltransferase OCH1-like enzyme
LKQNKQKTTTNTTSNAVKLDIAHDHLLLQYKNVLNNRTNRLQILVYISREMTIPRVTGASQRRSNNSRGMRYSSSTTSGPEYQRQRLYRMQMLCLAVVAFVVVMTGVRYYSRGHPNPVQFLDGKRIFGPAIHRDKLMIPTNDGILLFTTQDQRVFLEQNGWTCQASFASSRSSSKNLLLERFDTLPPAFSIELWKYCLLYTNPGVYWDLSMAMPMQLVGDIITSGDNFNFAIAMERNDPAEADASFHQPQLHHSFLRIREKHSKVALGMIRYLLEADSLSPASLHETLALFVANDAHKKRATWRFFTADCLDAGSKLKEADSTNPTVTIQVQTKRSSSTTHYSFGEPCAAKNREPCCQVWSANQNSVLPVLSLLHSHLVASPNDDVTQSTKVGNPLPFSFYDRIDTSKINDSDLGMPVSDLPYIATVREVKTNAPPATAHETPNFFDLLLRNNCLPPDKECYKCLKLGYKEGDEGGDCNTCADKCPCYCKALCSIRPPPKRLAAIWEVTTPRYRKDPSRLIPRVIHQTWFEPVTKEAYPNMSRLIESFRQSGWEYEFYDDDKAAQFLSAHFPPAVREAYDSIIPGAFKADLFRYCVLLIRGGVYADMDILLESNLDEAIDGSIGYLTPQDSPGETIGHRSCLWNGLMATAPGHVFLAQTIQNVVNNVRNRFTSVDYDDMLCPNPVLSVSHTVDTLYTCGPCILGASLNDVLKRHRQTGFEFGEIDIFETEKKRYASNRSSTGKRIAVSVDQTDPRLLIPGRSIILRQNKEDMGAHRFTHAAANLIVAATDMPEYDDRPKSLEHYSKSHVKFGVYGLTKLYKDNKRANEEVRIRVKPTGGFPTTNTI